MKDLTVYIVVFIVLVALFLFVAAVIPSQTDKNIPVCQSPAADLKVENPPQTVPAVNNQAEQRKKFIRDTLWHDTEEPQVADTAESEPVVADSSRPNDESDKTKPKVVPAGNQANPAEDKDDYVYTDNVVE